MAKADNEADAERALLYRFFLPVFCSIKEKLLYLLKQIQY